MQPKYISELNEKQKAAVTAETEPVLVLAGPGTGKTRLLTARIAYLVDNEITRPENILALTFTNKAAGELSSRLNGLLGENGKEIYSGTIHSFALQLIRNYRQRLDLPEHFSVCDQQYQLRLMIDLIEPFTRENVTGKARGILLSISNHQMKQTKLPSFAAERYNQYLEHLRQHRLIDFNQIILLAEKLLNENHDVLEEYRHLYSAVLVDEFQDTDATQYHLIRLLAEQHRNIFVVADDDQSIYSWRGAEPENIRHYMRDFGIKEAYLLEVNYRSGSSILQSAQNIIGETDRVQNGKALKVNKEIKDEIHVHFFGTEAEEQRFILEKLKHWSGQPGGWREIAIIYPFHKLANNLEQTFLNHQIPYQMAGSRSLKDNPLVKKIICFLRVVRDPNDQVALEEVAENELGIALLNTIRQNARKQKVTLRKAMYDLYRSDSRSLPGDSRFRLQAFVDKIANVINLGTFYSFSRVLDEIYSPDDLRQSSFLHQNHKHISPLTEALKLSAKIPESTANLRVAVAHADHQVRVLAAELIGHILKPSFDVAEQDFKTADLIFDMDETAPESSDTIIAVHKLRTASLQSTMVGLFKILQAWVCTRGKSGFDDFVVLDLETTGRDVDSCGIVEFAAVRVRNGEIVDQKQMLINPQMAIEKAAEEVHHISQSEVENAPTIFEAWPEIKNFIGSDLIIAHNGYHFDFTILDRFARKIDGHKLENTRFDSLTMAREIFPSQKNSIDALVARYGLDAGTRHRALDDVIVLVKILQHMQSEKSAALQKTSLEMFVDIVALGSFFEKKITAKEDHIFFTAGARKLVSPFSAIRGEAARLFQINESKLREDLQVLLARADHIYGHFAGEEHAVFKIRTLAAKFDDLPLDQAIAEFLSSLSLESNADQLEEINAVSLLTYHSAKGLEFDHVILLGLEEGNMPSFMATRESDDDDRPVSKKLEEQRRLLYVGITRARKEVVLTAVQNRGGFERSSSPYLRELGAPFEINNQ